MHGELVVSSINWRLLALKRKRSFKPQRAQRSQRCTDWRNSVSSVSSVVGNGLPHADRAVAFEVCKGSE